MSEQTRTLMAKLTRINALLLRYQHQSRRGHGRMGDPNRGQGRVLTLLKLQPEISQRELAYLLDMRAQSLGELLAKLERSGFITRTPSETDKRVMEIRLTEEGKQAAEQVSADQRDGAKLLDVLSEEEQATLESLLDRLLAQLSEELDDGEEDARDRRFDGPWEGGRGRQGYGPRGCPGGPMPMRGPGGPYGPRGPRDPHGPHGFYGEGRGPYGREDEHDRPCPNWDMEPEVEPEA